MCPVQNCGSFVHFHVVREKTCSLPLRESSEEMKDFETKTWLHGLSNLFFNVCGCLPECVSVHLVHAHRNQKRIYKKAVGYLGTGVTVFLFPFSFLLFVYFETGFLCGSGCPVLELAL